MISASQSQTNGCVAQFYVLTHSPNPLRTSQDLFFIFHFSPGLYAETGGSGRAKFTNPPYPRQVEVVDGDRKGQAGIAAEYDETTDCYLGRR